MALAYPSTENALPEVKRLISILRGQDPPDARQLGKSLWVSQGCVQGLLLGEPGVTAQAFEALALQDVEPLSPVAAVGALEALTAEPQFQAQGILDDTKQMVLKQLLVTLIQWSTEWLKNGGLEDIIKIILGSLA